MLRAGFIFNSREIFPVASSFKEKVSVDEDFFQKLRSLRDDAESKFKKYLDIEKRLEMLKRDNQYQADTYVDAEPGSVGL